MKENLFKRVSFLRGLLSLLFLVAITGNVWGERVVYTVKTTSSVEVTTGTPPNGSSATYKQDFTTAGQLTKASPNASLTLSGYDNCNITKITANLRCTNSAKVT